MSRSFTEHLAHLESLRDLKPGDRVRVTISGRTGTVERKDKNPHHGWHVRWDEPVFGVEVGIVRTANLERVVEEKPARTCGFDCTVPATVYGGFAGAGDWAGYACDEHAAANGFQVWERVNGG